MNKIMIIEDEETIYKELLEMLENNNYKVVVLKDFKNALSEILSVSPDLILLDINIPYINGKVLLHNLRKTSNIPVIMVTSRNSESDEVLSMSYGADDYITKPYNPTILLLRIAAIFKRCETNTNNISYKDFTFDISKGIESILEGSIITFMFLILIYGIYFLITYLCSKNIIRERI